ncbi:MAG: hypothetical protein WBL90_04825 [bacterium]
MSIVHKYRKQNKRKYIITILILIVVFYLLENTPLIPFRGKPFFQYGLKPSLLLLASYMIWHFPHLRPAGKLRLYGFLNSLALIFAGFYILAMFAGGLIDGLGKSPFSFTPRGQDVDLNDIIAYRQEKINITHRVIKIIEEEGEKRYQTQGDANGIPDAELVLPEQVRGKVIGVVPKLGWLTLLLRSDVAAPGAIG